MALMLAGLSAGTPNGRTVPTVYQAEGAEPRGVSVSEPVEPLVPAGRLRVSLGLPLGDPQGLADLLRDLHDPASPSYQQWLTPEAFAARFSPSVEDYAKVAAWARAKGLEVTRTYPNRLLICVSGTVPDIENAFGVRMFQYRHPSGLLFRSPDRVPTLDLDVAIDTVNGLNDLARPVKRLTRALPVPRGGSGPGGSFRGGDFRKAYAAGVPSSIQGAGQGIAMFEFSKYYPADLTDYWQQAGVTAPTVVDKLVDGGAADASGQDEVALDLEIAGSMAPSATLYVYMGQDGTTMLQQILNDNLCKAVSISWGWLSDGQTSNTAPQLQIDPTQDNVFKAMDAQGIACFVASGDSGPWSQTQWNASQSDLTNNPSLTINPADIPYLTSVGGTTLLTSSTGAWAGETPWNNGTGTSTGGPSQRYTMPTYQAGSGLAWASISGASTTMRNCPDVAADAVNFFVVQGSSPTVEYFDGTSGSAPLWAAFTALVNETAGTSLGNLNTILYKVGMGANYATSFHDVTSGNDGFLTGPGFDMASGWGSMVGQGTIEALVGEVKPVAPTIAVQPQGATASVGSTATFSVVATGTGPLSYQWSKNNAPIAGATSSSYTTPVVALADNGATFTVTVTNSVGSTTSTAAVLTVDAAPAITAQPRSVTVMTLQTATLSVTATGTAPLAYQWSKNGVTIAGATSATWNVAGGSTPNPTGDYYQVVVSNGLGSVTSDQAWVYVTSKSLDLNGDGVIDVLDLAALAAAYGANVPAAEFDGAATVDNQNVVIWLAALGGNP